MGQHRIPKAPRRRLLVGALAAAAALAGGVVVVSHAPQASADVVANATTADASVASDAPDTVQNTGWVSTDASPARYGYFKFAATVPAGQVVTKAIFQCWAGSSNSAGAGIWSASSAWSESALTWNTAPKPNFALPPSGSTGPVTSGSYAQADVTSAVTGSGPLTLVTKTTSSTRWSCASKENIGKHPAMLLVTTAPISTSPSSPNSAPTPAPTTSSTPAPSSTSPSSTSPSSTSTSPSSTATTTTAKPSPSTTSTSASPSPTTSTSSGSSGSTSSTGHKVMVIVEENHSQTEAINSMPYLASLANQYGQATAYHAVTHPSLPNYLAVAGGSTFGVTDDNPPSSHPIAGDSVFDQTLASGKTAKTYAESMTSNCQLSSSGGYAVKHNPWAYFNGSVQRSNCNAGDVPMGTTTSGNLLNDIGAGRLPTTGMMVPNLCNDAHDCSLGTADTWLKGWLPKLMAGPDYTSGKLTIIVTFDEDDSSSGNNVAFAVVDPRLNNAHKVVTISSNHYSMTRWYDQNAAAAPLRNASTAADLKAGFGL
jgi:hypothetical protein